MFRTGSPLYKPHRTGDSRRRVLAASLFAPRKNLVHRTLAHPAIATTDSQKSDQVEVEHNGCEFQNLAWRV